RDWSSDVCSSDLSSKGARITFSRATRSVTDGPFPDKELVSGFWMIQVKSKSEAVEWARRVPFADGEVVEIRQVSEASDFPAEVLPPEDAAREQSMREELRRKHGA